ncbi:MAG: hypothetical protein HYR51_10685 [Candidatus Rokubacteria bacterium]|nr:hypothetical protein [Candidatus Rokubacteria bacterium]
MPDIIHVTSGDVIAERLRDAGLPGRVAAGVDALHEGPAPGGVDGADWRALRADFVAARGWATRESALARLIELDEAVTHAGAEDEVVLWFEHDLHCQLMLVRLLDRLTRAAPRAVSLVGTGCFLSQADVAALFEGRSSLTPAAVAAARDAWAAFTSPAPAALAAVVARDTGALPYLAPALRRHLQQFPAAANGLARTEHAILTALTGGARPRRSLFEVAQAAEETPYMGDVIFWDYLEGLSRGAAPLVVEDGDGARLTARGRDVLEGRADAIGLRGIDRWLGGVHLTSPPAPRATPVWRWSAATRTLVRE